MGEGGNVCHYHKAVLSYGGWLESLLTFFDFDAVIVFDYLLYIFHSVSSVLGRVGRFCRKAGTVNGWEVSLHHFPVFCKTGIVVLL